jgi:hypothetical protein
MTNVTSKRPADVYEVLQSNELNPGARAATLGNLKLESLEIFGIGDKWKEVKCPDGSKAQILKNPDDAFPLYATEWTTKFTAVADLLNQAKINADVAVSNKIDQLFNNLNYVEATLREMYKNSYLTFSATPCSEKSQEEKRRMDRFILVASLNLVNFKMILEIKEPKNLDAITGEVTKLIENLNFVLFPNKSFASSNSFSFLLS